MTVATFSGLLIALLMSLLIFIPYHLCHLYTSVATSFLDVFLCTYAVIWLFVFIVVFKDRILDSPYSLSFNPNKLSGVKTKSGHDVVLWEHDGVGKIYGSIVIKPAVYEKGVMVESAILLPKSWNMKGLTDSDAYALVNCKNEHKRNCDEDIRAFHRPLNRFSMIKFFVSILLLKNKRI